MGWVMVWSRTQCGVGHVWSRTQCGVGQRVEQVRA